VLRKILTTQVILDYLNMRVQSHLLLAQVHYLHMSQGSYYTHNQWCQVTALHHVLEQIQTCAWSSDLAVTSL